MFRTVLALTFATASLAATAGAQGKESTDNRFEWSGSVSRGGWIRVKNLNGRINVRESSGSTARIVGVKYVRRGDDDYVRFYSEQLPNGGILVCALWGENSECSEDNYRSNNNNRHDDGRRNETEVEFTVELPSGVNIGAGTVNGDVDVTGATGEVKVSSVNGDVTATSTGGPVSGSTVNGGLRVRMGSVPPDADLHFSTVNGSIDITLPANFEADVELRTVNGSFRTDFPMTLDGRVSPRRLRAKIGRGGRELEASTVNGSIDLKKGE